MTIFTTPRITSSQVNQSYAESIKTRFPVGLPSTKLKAKASLDKTLEALTKQFGTPKRWERVVLGTKMNKYEFQCSAGGSVLVTEITNRANTFSVDVQASSERRPGSINRSGTLSVEKGIVDYRRVVTYFDGLAPPVFYNGSPPAERSTSVTMELLNSGAIRLDLHQSGLGPNGNLTVWDENADGVYDESVDHARRSNVLNLELVPPSESELDVPSETYSSMLENDFNLQLIGKSLDDIRKHLTLAGATPIKANHQDRRIFETWVSPNGQSILTIRTGDPLIDFEYKIKISPRPEQLTNEKAWNIIEAGFYDGFVADVSVGYSNQPQSPDSRQLQIRYDPVRQANRFELLLDGRGRRHSIQGYDRGVLGQLEGDVITTLRLRSTSMGLVDLS